jgi:dTDP-4-dehydrorhamnose 3,5-epimerase
MKYSVKKISGSTFKDHRGIIWTSWEKNQKKLKRLKFNHDKFSLSKKYVLRGIHWDKKTWKLISCVYGKFFFVVVNCNEKSNNYLNYKTHILESSKNIQILVPPYYGNAMLCLSKECIIHYKLSYPGKYNDIKNQYSIKWNDPRLKIKWPKMKKKLLSVRDK